MEKYMWIFILQISIFTDCFYSQNVNIERTKLSTPFNEMLDKENHIEKQLIIMRKRNEDMAIKQANMEARLTQLQVTHEREIKNVYSKTVVIEKKLRHFKQKYNELRVVNSELRRKQKEFETVTRRKLNELTKQCYNSHTIGKTNIRSKSTDNEKVTLKSKSTNISSVIPLHDQFSNSNSETRNIIKKMLTRGTPAFSKAIVAFHARPMHHLSNLGDNQPLQFDKVLFTEGPGYDGGRGTFQCVIPGVYVFSVTLFTFPNKHLEAVLVRNGSPLAYIYGYDVNVFGTGTNMAIVHLDAGDNVWVRVHDIHHSSGDVIYNDFTTYSGFLLQS